MRLQELGVHAVAEVGLNDDLVDLVLLGQLGDGLQRLGTKIQWLPPAAMTDEADWTGTGSAGD
jgi:hypothetical protein